jgi:hypothetical protein
VAIKSISDLPAGGAPINAIRQPGSASVIAIATSRNPATTATNVNPSPLPGVRRLCPVRHKPRSTASRRSAGIPGSLLERARIVLLAAVGMGWRTIGREVRCTSGTVSKWRVPYAHDRMSDLSETIDRSAEPRHGPEHRQRILAMLDQSPPAGQAN